MGRSGHQVFEYGPRLAAKKAKIPVFLIDREAAGKAGEDYVVFLGSNFIEQGKRAAEWLAKQDVERIGRVLEPINDVGNAVIIEVCNVDCNGVAIRGDAAGIAKGLGGERAYGREGEETEDKKALQAGVPEVKVWSGLRIAEWAVEGERESWFCH